MFDLSNQHHIAQYMLDIAETGYNELKQAYEQKPIKYNNDFYITRMLSFDTLSIKLINSDIYINKCIWINSKGCPTLNSIRIQIDFKNNCVKSLQII
jgi:hypothetical protein